MSDQTKKIMDELQLNKDSELISGGVGDGSAR